MSANNAWIMDMRASEQIVGAEERLVRLRAAFPGTDREQLHESPLFLLPHVLRRIVFFDAIYRQVLDVPGVIMEFGVRYGRDMAILDGLRTVHEPLNYGRRIVGFDTFAGFLAVEPQDGGDARAAVGELATTDSYEAYLDRVLETREAMAPFEHVRKSEVIKGDATETLAAYLEAHPETIVAFAYFDMDVYAPTKRCLELLRPHLTRGSVLGFDELNCGEFPGETIALREVLGLDRYALRRLPGIGPGLPSFLVVDR